MCTAISCSVLHTWRFEKFWLKGKRPLSLLSQYIVYLWVLTLEYCRVWNVSTFRFSMLHVIAQFTLNLYSRIDKDKLQSLFNIFLWIDVKKTTADICIPYSYLQRVHWIKTSLFIIIRWWTGFAFSEQSQWYIFRHEYCPLDLANDKYYCEPVSILCPWNDVSSTSILIKNWYQYSKNCLKRPLFEVI